MNRAIFSEDVRPISELKAHTAELLRHVHESRRPLLLTRRGRGVAVLLDLEEYERLVERQAFVEAVEAGAQAAAEGKLHSHAEAKALLETFGDERG